MTIENYLNLQDKVAIVTGAATGLGATTAQMLSNRGAKVLINHFPGQEVLAQEVAKDCVNENLCCGGDITKDEDCTKVVQTAIKHWGRVDILVNNAGINKFVEHYDLNGLSSTDFMNIYKVNVIGTFQMTRAVSSTMKQQGRGVIVNVSSGAGECGLGSSIAYCASKGALNTMTKSLGRALAPEIRVNAVCPAFIPTPLWDKKIGNMPTQEWEALRKTWALSTPLQLEGTPEIISRTILFLASDLSAHLTGQLITSDGGDQLGVYQPMFDEACDD